MSILDSFTVLFTSNVDELEAGEKRATEAGEQLQKKLEEGGKAGIRAGYELINTNKKVEESEKELEEENNRLAESFDKVKEHAGEAFEHIVEQVLETAAAFEALFAVEKLVDNFFEQAETSDKLGEQAKALGVDVEELDAWGQAVKRVGGSAEAFNGTVESMTRQLARAAATGHSRIAPFFKELGVRMTDAHNKARPVIDMLPEIADGFAKMSKAQSTGVGLSLGMDAGTIRLLQRGREEVDALIARQKMLGVITEEDAEKAERFNIEWDDVKQLFRSLVIDADSLILPMLETLLDGVEAIVLFLRDHKDLVIGFFIGLAAAAIYAIGPITLLEGALGILFAPLTLIIAAIAAIAVAWSLLYEDFAAYAKGHNSLLGEMVKKYPQLGEAIHQLGEAFKYIKDLAISCFHDIIAWTKRIPEGFRQWSEIAGIVGKYLGEAMRYGAEIIASVMPNSVKKLVNDISQMLSDGVPLWKAAFADTVTTAKLLFSGLMQTIAAVFNLIANLIVNPEHAFQIFWETMKGIYSQMIAGIDPINNAFRGMGDVMHLVGQDIIKIWHDIENVILGVWNKISGVVGSIGNVIAHPTSLFHLGQTAKSGGPMAPSDEPVSAPTAAPVRPTWSQRFHRALNAVTGSSDAPAAPYRVEEGAPMPAGDYQPPTQATIAAGLARGGPLPVAVVSAPAAAPGGLPAPVAGDVEAGRGMLADTRSPLMAQTPASISNSKATTVTQTLNVAGTTVNVASGDPQEIGEAVHNALQEHYTQAVNTLADGVSH